MRSATALAWLASALLASLDARAQSSAPASAPPTSSAAPSSSPPPVAALVAPKLLSDPSAPYPDGARGDATVVLTITVDDDGTVSAAVPLESTPPFSARAADAARGWLFEPATRDGKPVRARIRVEVIFHAPRPAIATDASAADHEGVAAANAPGDSRALEVHVHGERAPPSRSVTLTRTEVRQIPGVFGDPFRAIEVMPGVTPIVSGLPFFFVRGAPPGDVGYYLDGVRVPYLFHVGAGPSVIHPALVDRVDLYPGGYPARFGRFSGGIVSGETAAPASTAHGELNVRLFDAGAFVETPFAADRGTVTLAGRYSYTAAILSLVQPNVALDYWDYQARIGYDLTPRDRVSAFSFGASDFLGDKTGGRTTTLFGVTFHRVDLRYDHRLDADGTLRLAVTGGLDDTSLDSGRYVRDRLVGARAELVYRLAPAALLRAGVDGEADRYDLFLDSGDQSTSDGSLGVVFPARTDLALGTRADVVIDAGPRLEITPGARVDAYASDGATAVAVDPRLATRTVLTDHVRFLSALGIAHQVPSFVAPVPGFQPAGLHGGLQTAMQESAGIEADLAHAITATVTLFHNGFFNLSDALSANAAPIPGCGSAASDTFGGSRSCNDGQTIPTSGDAQTVRALEARTNGSAYGFEVFVKKRLTQKLGGFVSYTLSRSVRTANGQTFVAPFDRTHVANAAVAYDLGRNWRAGTRLIFYTGLPKAADPSDPSATRLAPFFRIDLRLEKRWQLSARAWISFVVEWLNATLSTEALGTSCTLSGCQEQRIGPVTIPSLGLEAGF